MKHWVHQPSAGPSKGTMPPQPHSLSSHARKRVRTIFFWPKLEPVWEKPWAISHRPISGRAGTMRRCGFLPTPKTCSASSIRKPRALWATLKNAARALSSARAVKTISAFSTCRKLLVASATPMQGARCSQPSLRAGQDSHGMVTWLAVISRHGCFRCFPTWHLIRKPVDCHRRHWD